MKLHIYEHCPYCVKARMIFGFKHIPVTLNYILNDDVETPTNMIGQKMVPILEKEDGTYMPESMDIVHYIDGLEGQKVLTGQANPVVAEWLAKAREYTSKLAMPRWVRADFGEFKTPGARKYFKEKKTASIGSFEENLNHTAALIEKANAHLVELEPIIQSPTAVHGVLSEDDIHLFATLRSLSIVKGLQYPPKVDVYRREMAEASGVPLLDGIAV